MANYVPLVAQAVAGLPTNAAADRLALYGRARQALVAQLREMKPPLSNQQIISEQADLEAAIRKIEAEQAATEKLKPAVTPIAPMPRMFPRKAAD